MVYRPAIDFNDDEVAEWLRRWTANPMGSARVGSNPILVVRFFFMFLCTRKLSNASLEICPTVCPRNLGPCYIASYHIKCFIMLKIIQTAYVFLGEMKKKGIPLPGIEPGPAG